MSFETWAAFAAASAVLVAIPGPTVLLVCAYALGAGRTTAMWSAAGVAAGDLVAMTASMLGLGAILAASGVLFEALRYAGAAYLVWLGWRMWRSQADSGAVTAKRAEASGPRMALHAFAVTATNPKGILFFVAFVPLFIDPTGPLAPQAAILIVTFTGIGWLNALLYALAAGTLRERLARPGALLWMHRGGGLTLMGMGAATALGAQR